MNEKRHRYEQCLIAISTGALDDDELKRLHLVRQIARAEYLEAKVAYEAFAHLANMDEAH